MLWISRNFIVLRDFENVGHAFFKTSIFCGLERNGLLDAGLGSFPKIIYFVHSKRAHIKIKPDISCRAGICGPTCHFVMGWNSQFEQILDLWTVYPSGWGFKLQQKFLATNSIPKWVGKGIRLGFEGSTAGAGRGNGNLSIRKSGKQGIWNLGIQQTYYEHHDLQNENYPCPKHRQAPN